MPQYLKTRKSPIQKCLITVFFCLFSQLALSAGEITISVFDNAQKPVPNVVVILPDLKSAGLHKQQQVIDQIDVQFSPQLVVIEAGSKVTFPNSDKTRHHIYSFSPAKVFELPLYASSEVEIVTFDKPGIVHLGCNIHDQMHATLVVSEARVFAISDANGEVRLPATMAMPGNAMVWHKQIGHDKPLAYALSLQPDSEQAKGQIELNFLFVPEKSKPKKLTLKEKLKKYKK